MTAAPDLYQVLGLGRDADAAEIKRAYRRHAKREHPDANPEDPTAADRFKAIRFAFEVLSDSARRARYDATGDTDAPPVESPETETAKILGPLLASILAELLLRDADPGTEDLKAYLVKSVRMRLTHLQQDLDKGRRAAARLDGAARRFGHAGGKEEILAGVVRKKHAELLQVVEHVKGEIEKHERAAAYLKDITYDAANPFPFVFGQLTAVRSPTQY